MKTVAVVGCGPAGIAATLQLARQGLSPLIFEAGEPGGLLREADLVENYPGFPGGVSGPELAALFLAQLGGWGVEPLLERVSAVKSHEDGFLVVTERHEYPARRVILAPGTRPRPYPVPSAVADRVHASVRELDEVTGGRIAIIGAGDAAFDYALNLARRNEVFLVERSSRAVCLPLLAERASGVTTIHRLRATEVVRLERTADGLMLRCSSVDGPFDLEVDRALRAIGREPRRELLDYAGHPPDEPLIVGDAVNGPLRQTALAVADGLRAALRVAGALQGDR